MAGRCTNLALFLATGLLIGCGGNGKGTLPTGTDAIGLEKKEEIKGPVAFKDITASSGITFTYHNGEEANHLSILESLGGGVALIDYDRDGLLDIFLTGGGKYTGKDRKDIVGLPCRLYRNKGSNTFEDVTQAVGLDKLAGGRPWFYSHGTAVADYDRDGWPDLLVTGWQAVALFRNVAADPSHTGKGRRFKDVTQEAGLGNGINWATSAAFGDLNGDGYPELYIAQYVDWSWKNHPTCSFDGKLKDVCPPKNFSGLPDKLYRNTGKGAFVDISREAGLVGGGENASKGLGVLMVDINGNSKPDIYVANDTVDNFLYINQSQDGKILLKEDGLSSGVARDDRGSANGSMGLDAGDPERKGKPCLWVTNYENELHALYRNRCRPGQAYFHYGTLVMGIAAIGQSYVGWGTGFIDFNRDGWEDLFIGNGHAIRYPRGKEANRKLRPVLLQNQQGKFRNAGSRLGSYFKTLHQARGVGIGDLNNDGLLDLVISHLNEPVAILQGVGSENQHWLGVELVGKSHASVVGAKVVFESEGKQQARFAKGGGSYASANDPRLLFGLGRATSGRLIITWPNGKVQEIKNPAVDGYHRIPFPG